MKYILYACAFVAELMCWGSAASISTWLGGGSARKAMLGIAFLVIITTFWGLFMAPKAPYRLGLVLYFAIKFTLYAFTTAILWSHDHRLAILFITLVVISEPFLVGDERNLRV